MANEKFEMLQKEYDELEARFKHIVDVLIPENKEKLEAARSQGDLSENYDYHAAKDEQGKLDAEMKELEYKLNNAVILNVVDDKICSMGKTVEFERLDNHKKMVVEIVGGQNASPTLSGNIKITLDSPVGRALKERKVGEVVRVNIAKPYDIKILSIKIS